MSVTVELPSALERYSDGQTLVQIEAADAQAVLDRLWERFPDLRMRVLDRDGLIYPYLLLFRNGDKLPRTGLDAIPVTDGDRLELVALAEGG